MAASPYAVWYNGGWQNTTPDDKPFYIDAWHALHQGTANADGTVTFAPITNERTGTADLSYGWATTPGQSQMSVSAPTSGGSNASPDWVSQNVKTNADGSFTVNADQVANIGANLVQTARDNGKYAQKSGSIFTQIRDALEGAAVVAGNYFLPGSSILTSHLASNGAQDLLNTPLGQIANLAAGASGSFNGNVSNYGDLLKDVGVNASSIPSSLGGTSGTAAGTAASTGGTLLDTAAKVAPIVSGVATVAGLVDQNAQAKEAAAATQAALAAQNATATAALNSQTTAQNQQLAVAQQALAAQKSAYDNQLLVAQQQLQQESSSSSAALAAAGQQFQLQQAGLQAQVAAANTLYTQQAEQMNRLNQKQPDTAAINGANLMRSKSGQSGTMITGPTGVDPNSLLLSKNTLLGS